MNSSQTLYTIMPILEDSDLTNETNEALPEIQKREIYALISKERREIEAIDEEIDTLRLRRSTKVTRIEVLKTIVSPVKDVPNEVFAKIFVQYTRDLNSKYRTKYEVPIPRLPWRLGHICSRWRGAALSTGELWKDFSIKILPADWGSSPIGRATELFRRTGNWPISLHISRNDSQKSLTQLIPSFTQNAARIHHLIFHNFNQNLWPMLELPQGLLAILETLDICFDSNSDMNDLDNSPQLTLFESSLSLRRVSIDMDWSEWVKNINPLVFHLPWSQLTHLHISERVSLQFTPAYELLSKCSGLVEISLCIPKNDEEVGNLPMITLQRLEVLHSSSAASGEYGQFIRHLVLPSLKQFNFSARSNVHWWSGTDMIGLITRSACRLKAFKGLREMPDDFLLCIPECMPYLTRLSIGDEQTLYPIFRNIAQGTHLHDLQTLECTVSMINIAVDNLKIILEECEPRGQLEGTRTLLTVFLVPISPPMRDDTLRLNTLQRNWLTVRFRRKADENFMNDLALAIRVDCIPNESKLVFFMLFPFRYHP